MRMIGVYGLRAAMSKFCKFLQGELFFNKHFVGSLVSMMMSEQNVILQLQFASCVSSICKTERGMALITLVRDCSFPTATVKTIQDAAHNFHRYGTND